jgi:hypothetical protein
MNKSVLICLLFCSLTINTVLANVTVVVNQKQYIFAHPPRLVEILTPIAAQQNWYWPGVTLYETDDSQLEVERQLRFPVKIDYDLARVVAAANPQLPPGKYILDIRSRMHTVQLFGAINKTATLPHLPHADVSEYIISQNLTDLGNKDIVTIIQADGRKITAPVAYWNKTHQEVMPGSQIFVPFKQSIFQPELATINQQIINLALNRVQQ